MTTFTCCVALPADVMNFYTRIGGYQPEASLICLMKTSSTLLPYLGCFTTHSHHYVTQVTGLSSDPEPLICNQTVYPIEELHTFNLLLQAAGNLRSSSPLPVFGDELVSAHCSPPVAQAALPPPLFQQPGGFVTAQGALVPLVCWRSTGSRLHLCICT